MNSHNEIVIKFLFLALVCVLVWGDVEARCIEREREALVSFKNGLIDEHGILSSWRRSDECCKWYGVVCSNTTGHVTRLELGSRDFDGVLGGKVSSSLLELHHLTYLNLSHNDFGGDRIPPFIGSMKQLQYLYLWSSNFSGIVPPQLGNLTNLRTLNLSHNSLMSENLDWISGLSSLSVLDLSYSFDLNDTNGVEQILALHSLQELHLRSCNINDVNPLIVNSSSTSLSILDLHDNHLTSSAFDWLFNVSMNIVHIDLSKNALGSLIPNSFLRLAHLEYLDLSSNMLSGEIPTSLFNLSHLQELVLYENGLIGSLDELLGNLSANGFSSSLQILDLARNRFHGSIPDLRGFSALTQVYLSFNNFTGFVPLSLGQLSKLQNLDVANNHLKGVVSESHLTKLGSLTELDLSFNSLTLRIAPDWNPPFQLNFLFLAECSVGPSFPNWIQTQRNLVMLDLSSAGIIDEVPVGLWSLSPLLVVLFLSDNQFSGTIPDLSAIGIQYIDLSSNKFSGLIPSFHLSIVTIQLSQNMLFGSLSSFCQTPHDQLVFLDLSDNRLSGELPDCWEKNLPNLQDVHLDNNSFSGRIPLSLGSLANLYSLRLNGNNLSGELPSTLRLCPELRFMDVRGNKLTGEIPAWIGEIYQLQYLNLRSNKLDGGVTPAICNLTDIRILDISRNKLSGRIPDCFNNTFALMQTAAETRHVVEVILSILLDPQLPNRKILKHYSDYSSIQWKGRKSEALHDLLKLIDFSSNRFIGNIPQSISRMRGLISLNLSRNRLTGKIIPDIGQMGRLESLDLSHNQLSGAIPTSLAQLHFLSVLDLSSNNLSGKIPSGTQLQSFNPSSYAENNGLCGEPLALCPQDRLRPPPTATTHREKDDGIWRLSFMQGLVISIVFGFILGFWGVVGSFIIKKTWRNAFFNLLDAAGDWFYVRIAIFLSKWRRT